MTSSRIKGQCASPGFAAGVVATLDARRAVRRAAVDSAAEVAALRQAIAESIAEVAALSKKAEGDAADMLAFQVAMLEDEALAEDAFAAIAQGKAADAAWSAAMADEIAGYEASDDEYFRARASDLADIRERVLDALTGSSQAAVAPGSIVLADDITPTRFLSAEWSGGAILLRKGSATSHVAMLARSRGVPMIVGLPANDIAGREVLVDAMGGLVVIDPSPAEQALFLCDRTSSERRAAEAAAYLEKPAVTHDGVRITTLVNIADPAELDHLDPTICDGIGLVRTELVFEGKALPSEDGQATVYSRIVRWAAGRPVTFRTLDAGGDKPIPGLTPTGESNPFLGVRGVRLTLMRKDVFLPQLRALARAAALGEVEVMIPMVSVPEELEASRALLAEACDNLRKDGVAYRMPKLGMMVEVPAAALTLERFDAAFLSIGSNDLTQYVMAAGRDIADVASLADPSHPAVLRLIGMIAAHGARHGVKVSLCGDAGGDERLIPLLLRQGIRTVSMSPRLLAGAKRAIAGVTLGDGHG
jgi:phosphoenolpyruvate-protein phosphotransferase (PTS system enzyme I)